VAFQRFVKLSSPLDDSQAFPLLLKSMLQRRTLLLFMLALGLRLLLQGWDAGTTSSTPHPDERQVGYVTEKAEGWFADPGFYAYGSLHFHAVRATAYVLGISDNLRGILIGGRALSLTASMLAILLGWIIARRAWGRRTGDLFLLLAAWVPLDLQQSHFATVEAHHSAWVVAALAACFWLANSGRPVAAAAAGAAIGASLAVKVASLALGLPLAVALLLAGRGRRPWEVIRLAAVATITGATGFWLCQPWAFAGGIPPLSLIATTVIAVFALEVAARRDGSARPVLLGVASGAVVVALIQGAALLEIGADTAFGKLLAVTLAGAGLNPAYLAGVGAEVAMVVGRADLAYVRVYAHTLPVLYPLRELAAWGLGALLLAAVIIGVSAGAWRLCRRWRRWLAGRWSPSMTLLLLLLAWLVPMAVRLSTLQVKFLRYWEPLVVPAVMVAAWWLQRISKRYRRRAVMAVAAGTIVWGLAYIWAFVEPHPHLTASRWLSPMLGDRQVVAFEHWDEHIELNTSPKTVELVELPSYELPDDDDKILGWCQNLERADWVVLTSNRVFRTVRANPHRFPRTARLYRLLFAGEAGFEPLARARRGPRIFGLRWPVQRADESFLNYEFPEVIIFRRTTDVPARDLAQRVERPLPFLEELDAAEIESRFLRQVPAIPSPPSGIRQAVDIAIWVFVFIGLGIASWTLLLPVLRRLPDAGTGLALATGWIVPGWLMWIGSELHIWPTGPVTASWLFLALLAAGAVAGGLRRLEIIDIVRRRRTAIMLVLAVAAVVGGLFLVVRLFNPAVHWGEKPMDFSFLNAFLREPHWPTDEPWMAGMPLHYYYFGEVLASFPILVNGCSAGVGYNLMSATIPAIGAAILAGFGLLLRTRRRVVAASVLPLLVYLTGNLAWPWLLDGWRDGGVGGSIFDLWWATSRVIPGFAIDEYPLWTTLFADLHGHFIALPLLLATFAWGWLCVHADDRRWGVSAVMCGLGAAVVVATNPWDLFILTSTLAIGVAVSVARPLRAITRLCVAAAVSMVAAAPFIVELVAGISAGAGERGLFLTDENFAPAWAILDHFGLFLVPLAALAVVTLGKRIFIALVAAAIGVTAGLAFGSSAAALALAATAVFATVAMRTQNRLERLSWSLAALGTLAVAACERFTLIDRMNTIFKVYNGVWVLLAFALAVALLRTRDRKRLTVVAVWLPLQLVAIINLPLGIAQGWLRPRMISPRPTLDGQAFLASQDRQTWFLVHSLQGAARPGDVVAEAAGPYYSHFTRITMHTGQPTVVGWDWHLKQRGQSPTEIAARFADLETLYAGNDRRARRAVLDRYNVRWVVVARVEREAYNLTGQDPLAGVPGVQKIAEQGEAILYRVVPETEVKAAAVESTGELPPGVRIIGRLPEMSRDIVRSIAVDELGATAILYDGEIVELDLDVGRMGVLSKPPCDVSSVDRQGETRWTACRDGSVWRLAGGHWRTMGRLAGADQLTADEDIWAWGPGGLWQLGRDGDWRHAVTTPIAAAAAGGAGIAWSDGSRVWVGNGESERIVGTQLKGVRALAWQGSVLWALDTTGLRRSGGTGLPWRDVGAGLGRLVSMAGCPRNLWLVREDGAVIETNETPCPSPWAGNDHGLREPRGIVVSPQGWFAVADTFNHRVLWFTEAGECLDAAGSEGSAPGSFRQPSGLALAENGSLRQDGVFEVVGGGLFGPRDLLWAADGSLLVADTGNRKLVRFTPPGWEKETIVELPGPPVGLVWVGDLIAVAVPADGAILLVDVTNGTVNRRIEMPPWSNLEQQEGYLAMLPSGHLAASSPFFGQLWEVDPSGARPPRAILEDFPGMTAIALMPDGRLLASLTWANRLVKVEIDD
jgi:YYY domain-containing protein